jgi:hypothetical protein
MVERDQVKPGQLLRLTRPYTIGHVSSGQEIILGTGERVTVVGMVDEGEAKGHIALLLADGKLHRIAAWWLEVNSVLVADQE